MNAEDGNRVMRSSGARDVDAAWTGGCAPLRGASHRLPSFAPSVRAPGRPTRSECRLLMTIMADPLLYGRFVPADFKGLNPESLK